MNIRAAIAYEDWAQEGTALGGSWTLPRVGTEDAVISPQLSDVFGISYETAQAGSALGRTYGRVWGDLRPVQIISLLDVRITGTAIFDLFLLGGSGGGLVAEASVGYEGFPSSQFVRHLHIILDAPRPSTGASVYMRRNASIADGAGSITAGRLWAGPLWHVPEGIKRAWRSGVIDPGEKSRSPGGQNYPSPEQRRRWVKMGFSHVDFEQAYGVEDNSVLDIQQLQVRAGTTSPIMVFPRLQQHAIHRAGIYGTATEWDPIENVAGDYFSSGLRVEEDL